MAEHYTLDGEGTLAERIAQRAKREDHLLLPVSDVIDFLIRSARDNAEATCDAFECEPCNAFLAMWWRACNGLTRQERRDVQRSLREADIPLPDGPWEEVA